MRLAPAVVSSFALLVVAGCASAPVAEPGAAGPVAKAPRVVAFKPSDALNRTAAELDALFGAPALTRTEGEGEFRRYAFATCSLIVILYPDGEGAGRAQHLSAAALVEGAQNPTVEDCLAHGVAR